MPRRPRPGSIVSVPLGAGQFGFGRVLIEPLIEFFDHAGNAAEPDLETVLQSRVLFRIAVMNNATTTARWPVIGFDETADPDPPTVFFRLDAITAELFLYEEDRVAGTHKETPATRQQVEGLEHAAVWSAEHVEDRLRDHFAGVPNKWVEATRLPDA